MHLLGCTDSLGQIRDYLGIDGKKMHTDSAYWFQIQKCLALRVTFPHSEGRKSLG